MIKTENIGFGGLKLMQNSEEFCYGVDAVLLADFAYSLCPHFGSAVDLGTGTGIIPFILSHKNKEALFKGIELQPESVKMAMQGCKLNDLEDRIDFIRGDIADESVLQAASGFEDRACEHSIGNIDMVTCNPPYVARGAGLTNESTAKYIARHETTAVLDDFVKAAASLLKGKGHFFMVHRPSRLVDVFCCCRKQGLEPKDIRFVSPRVGEAPNIVLVHCVAGGGRELKYMKELYVYEPDGSYSEEIEIIYERK